MGYLRLMHVNALKGTMLVRTYSPSLKQYGSQGVETSTFTPQDEEFTIDLTQLEVPAAGNAQKAKTLTTDSVSFDELSSNKIGQASTDPASGSHTASVTWKNAPAGRNGWYATIDNKFGGRFTTPVTYTNAVEQGNDDTGGNNGSGTGDNGDGSDNGGGASGSPTGSSPSGGSSAGGNGGTNGGNPSGGSSANGANAAHAKNSSLAHTGANVLGVFVAALVLLAIGIGLAIVSRLRHHDDPGSHINHR